MMRLFTLPALTLFGLPADAAGEAPWQRPFREVAALEAREADLRLAYGDSDQQFAELWLPPAADRPAPAVMLIHGGCWLADYDIAHIRPLAAAIAGQGFAVWALEYRRVGQEGGGWPGTFHDIADAVDFLAAYRYPAIDADRFALAGHSAGGHLALWAAGRNRLVRDSELYRPEPALPRGAVGLAAIADLAAYAAGGNSCQQVAPRLMGGTPEQAPARYGQASPAVLGSDVPVVTLQGKADPIVPHEQAQALPGADAVFLDSAGHFDLIHPGTPAFPALVENLKDLLKP